MWKEETTPIGIVFTFATVMAFVVGIVIVFQIFSTDVNEHIGEYATFKAMGYISTKSHELKAYLRRIDNSSDASSWNCTTRVCSIKGNS